MRIFKSLCIFSSILLAQLGAPLPATAATVDEIVALTRPNEWRALDPENTLYLELPAGRVVIELAPEFAPNHVANVKALVREKYFDGLSILRAQDNYVVQWGDPDAEKPDDARKIKTAKKTLPPEFDRAIDTQAEFTPLADGDTYAPEVGFARGFRVARDPKSGRSWLVHTYGAVGAGRDNAPDSGGGTELYVVIGQAPRHLDRNVTLLGRVIQGMELLSVMPRGPGAMGFYTNAEMRTPIKAMRVASDLPVADRTKIETLRTDSESFKQIIEARRNRREPWFARPAGKIDISAVPILSRVTAKK